MYSRSLLFFRSLDFIAYHWVASYGKAVLIRRTLEPFQRQRWGNFWQTVWSAYGLFRAHSYHLELNWTELNWKVLAGIEIPVSVEEEKEGTKPTAALLPQDSCTKTGSAESYFNVSLIVRGKWKWPSRYTGGQSNPHKWLASRKIWSVEELETLPAGTKPRTSHHRSPGGERRGKRKRYTIFLKRRSDGHRQSDEHCDCFKGNVGETSERLGGAHMFFSSASIPSLNWTDLNW